MPATESTALYVDPILSRGFLDSLERSVVLPALMTRSAEADFAGNIGRTVDMRKPQVRTAQTAAVGPRLINDQTAVGGPLVTTTPTLPTLNLVGGIETYIPIKIDTRVYDRQPVSDFALTMDVQDRAIQLTAPSVRAVARGLEDRAALLMSGATYAGINSQTIKGLTATTNPSVPDAFLDRLIDLAVDLDSLNVPREDRWFVCGTQYQRGVLRALGRRLDDQSKSATALDQATVERVGGFNIVVSNAVAATAAYAFHRSAYMMAMRAPVSPQGVISSQSLATDSVAMTLIQDYLPDTSQESTLISTFVGTAVNTDPGQSGAGNPAGAPVFSRAIRVTVDLT